MRSLIIGTAGHIDHGKSALLKALTGTDPDRLAEEQQRGMTIDIGFAFLNTEIAFIDVPGHERFIKNMVTGAGTITAAMLVVAADDGIMPQTREHFDILRLLGIRRGLIVITKIDLVDDAWLELVAEEIYQFVKSSFLSDAPLFRVSNITGQGIAELKQYLLQMAAAEPEAPATQVFRMPIDRVFSVKGYGTVVTGSILSGAVETGQLVELMPHRRLVKVRRIQSQHREMTRIEYGRRAALNLQGIEVAEIRRGHCVVTPEHFTVSRRITVQLTMLPQARELKHRQLIRVHAGTGEFIAKLRCIGHDRIRAGQTLIAQLEFDGDVVVGFRDRLILRSYSPPQTVAGALVLDNNASLIRLRQYSTAASLEHLVTARLNEAILFYLEDQNPEGGQLFPLAQRFSVSLAEVQTTIEQLIAAGNVVPFAGGYVARRVLDQGAAIIKTVVTGYHRAHPLEWGVTRAAIQSLSGLNEPFFSALVEWLINAQELQSHADRLAQADFSVQLTASQQAAAAQLLAILEAGAFAPPELSQIESQTGLPPGEFSALVRLLEHQGQLVVIDRGLALQRETVETGRRLLTDYLQQHGPARVAQLKEVLQTSRKWAVPLLNYYDRLGLTRRCGDFRELVEDGLKPA